MRKILVRIILGIFIILAALLAVVWSITFHPKQVQSEDVVCGQNTPQLKPGQDVKILSWNVQFMAGKEYVFFFDVLDGSGPDDHPSAESIRMTLSEVARIIRDEDPDIVLLQEVDDGAGRTGNEDQLAQLLKLLPESYACHASAFYWQADYVPHPRIPGSVGMKVSTISKYRITQATRHQLDLIPSDPLTQQFNLKRAILAVTLPVNNSVSNLIVLNTHLDAFAQGTTTMQDQVNEMEEILTTLTANHNSWVIGGDFNLLPPNYYHLLPSDQRAYYNAKSELTPLWEKYQFVPNASDLSNDGYEKWFTHFPNDPIVNGPDRTIDYLVFSDKIIIGERNVRSQDTLAISDHLPLISTFTLTEVYPGN